MGEVGRVVEVDGDYVRVRLKRHKACEKCRACAPGTDGEHMYMNAINSCNADVDDQVRVSLDGGFFLRAVLIMYGLPLAAMLAGFGAGHLAADALALPLGELVSFASGIASAAAVYVGINRLRHRIVRGNYTPVAGSIMEDAEG